MEPIWSPSPERIAGAHRRAVKNRDALANPQALDFFKDLPELAE